MATLQVPVTGAAHHGPGLAPATGSLAAFRVQLTTPSGPTRAADAHVVAAGKGRGPAMYATKGGGRGREAGAPVRLALVGAAVKAARLVAPHLVEAGDGRPSETRVGAVRRPCAAPSPVVEGVAIQGGVPPDAAGEAARVAIAPGVGGAARGAAPLVAVRTPQTVNVAAVGAPEVPAPSTESPPVAAAGLAVATATEVVPVR